MGASTNPGRVYVQVGVTTGGGMVYEAVAEGASVGVGVSLGSGVADGVAVPVGER